MTRTDSVRAELRSRAAALRLPGKLRADCSACCGLCCVALPFDASQGFLFDKPAHMPCAMLRSDDRCSIHHALVPNGFPGCAQFDCYGAGQWVVQREFKGASWRDSPQMATRMFDAFWRARVLHELMAMLALAIGNEREGQVKRELCDKLSDVEALKVEGLERIDLVALRCDVMNVLSSTHRDRVAIQKPGAG